jgi:hypothetical protein
MIKNNFSLLPTSDIAKCLLVLFAKKTKLSKIIYFSVKTDT